jgi:aminoglycoside phosphotransferase
MYVSVQKPDGTTERCIIKTRDRIEILEREARVIGALAEFGVPVPTVLAGPANITDESGMYAAIVLNELPGQSLPWLGTTSLAEADFTCRLLIQGVNTFHQLTEQMSQHNVATILPHTTLPGELSSIVERGGEWLDVDIFARAIAYLRRSLDDIQVPLAFSNGDYNPLNFLHDGTKLTGFIDFEHACFEDPHAGFAKFITLSVDAFGWGTGMKAGLVERYLYSQGVSRREFIPRLILLGVTQLSVISSQK